MKKMKTWGWRVVGILLILCVWPVIQAIVSEPLLVPSITDVLKALFTLGSNGRSAILMSASRLLMILGVAGVSGIILGFLASINKTVDHILAPSITLLRTIPVISVIVLILVVVGFRMTPYIVTYLMIFPTIFQATKDSINDLDQAYVDVFKLDQTNAISALRYCYLPLISVPLSTAFLHAAGLGIKVLVMTEYLSQTPRSVGFMLYRAKTDLRYDVVFAWTIVLIVMMIGLESIIHIYKKRHSQD